MPFCRTAEKGKPIQDNNAANKKPLTAQCGTLRAGCQGLLAFYIASKAEAGSFFDLIKFRRKGFADIRRETFRGIF